MASLWSSRRAELVLCALATTSLFWAFALPKPFTLGDEGFRYLLSQTWAEGESLFTHYHALYVTGQFAWYGLWMRLLGPALVGFRLAGAVLGGAAATVLFLAIRRLAPPMHAWAAVLAVAVLAVPRPATLASALVFCLALDLALRRRPPAEWVLAVSALAGLLAGWREDSAVLALVLAAAGVACRKRWRELITLVAPGAVGGFLPWLAVAAVRGETLEFASHVGRRLLLLVERLSQPTEVPWKLPKQLPTSPRGWKRALLPLFAAVPVVFYGLMLSRELIRWRWEHTLRPTSLAAALVGFAYLPQFLWERRDPAHFQFHLHILLAVAAVATAFLSRRWRLAATAGLAAAALIGAALFVVQNRLDDPRLYPCCHGRRIGARLLGGSPPWAGLDRSDGATLIVLGWGPGWYALEGLPPGTPYLYSGPRHLLSDAQLARLAADLQRPTNRYVIQRRSTALPPAAVSALQSSYREASRWHGWALWEQAPAAATEMSSEHRRLP